MQSVHITARLGIGFFIETMLQRLWEHLVVKHGGIITDSFDLQVSVCVVRVCETWREREGGSGR